MNPDIIYGGMRLRLVIHSEHCRFYLQVLFALDHYFDAGGPKHHPTEEPAR